MNSFIQQLKIILCTLATLNLQKKKKTKSLSLRDCKVVKGGRCGTSEGTEINFYSKLCTFEHYLSHVSLNHFKLMSLTLRI